LLEGVGARHAPAKSVLKKRTVLAVAADAVAVDAVTTPTAPLEAVPVVVVEEEIVDEDDTSDANGSIDRDDTRAHEDEVLDASSANDIHDDVDDIDADVLPAVDSTVEAIDAFLAEE
jgi:hypothetical protein